MSGRCNQGENPLFLSIGEIAAAASKTSEPFWIKHSETFSFELRCTAGTPNVTVALEQKSYDGEWFAATGISTQAVTDARSFIMFSPRYSRNEFRLKLTNNDGSAATWVALNHFR